MPFSKESLKKNPYNKCIICDKLGDGCDGANLLCLDIPQISEWINIRQDYLRLTNEQLAEDAEVSTATVARIKAAAKNGDHGFQLINILRVVRALIGRELGKHPCPMSGATDSPIVQELKEQCRQLKAALDQKDKAHAEAVQAAVDKVEREADKKVRYLLRALKIVSVFSAVLILFMVAAILCDMMNHDLGFFWRG